MTESDVPGDAGVPEDLLDDLVQVLLEKIDVLLDRLTDRAVAAPTPGTHAWRAQWTDRDSPQGLDHRARRQAVRTVLAERAGLVAASSLPYRTTPPTPTAVTAPPRRRRASSIRVADDQLAMF